MTAHPDARAICSRDNATSAHAPPPLIGWGGASSANLQSHPCGATPGRISCRRNHAAANPRARNVQHPLASRVPRFLAAGSTNQAACPTTGRYTTPEARLQQPRTETAGDPSSKTTFGAAPPRARLRARLDFSAFHPPARRLSEAEGARGAAIGSLRGARPRWTASPGRARPYRRRFPRRAERPAPARGPLRTPPRLGDPFGDAWRARADMTARL
eukprot:scaffold334_cov241-Pinguiococcus_pyrenoidosus.AAC.24